MANNNILLSQSDYLVEVSYYVADNFKTIIIIKKTQVHFKYNVKTRISWSYRWWSYHTHLGSSPPKQVPTEVTALLFGVLIDFWWVFLTRTLVLDAQK